MLIVALNISVFAGEKSQDAGIQRTEPEVWDFKFDFSVERFFMVFYSFHFRNLPLDLFFTELWKI